MEQNTTKPQQIQKQVLVVVIHRCEHATYWYAQSIGAQFAVVESDDYYILHDDYVDRNREWRMIDKGDAEVIGRLTKAPADDAGERIADMNQLAAEFVKEVEDFVAPSDFDKRLLDLAKNNTSALVHVQNIVNLLQSHYGMKTALVAVMDYFNQDHVTVPKWIYELVFSRIAQDDKFGWLSPEDLRATIEQYKKVHPESARPPKKATDSAAAEVEKLANFILNKYSSAIGRTGETPVDIAISLLSEWVDMPNAAHVSDCLYQFIAWFTSQKERMEFVSTYHPNILKDIVDRFIKDKGLPQPTRPLGKYLAKKTPEVSALAAAAEGKKWDAPQTQK